MWHLSTISTDLVCFSFFIYFITFFPSLVRKESYVSKNFKELLLLLGEFLRPFLNFSGDVFCNICWGGAKPLTIFSFVWACRQKVQNAIFSAIVKLLQRSFLQAPCAGPHKGWLGCLYLFFFFFWRGGILILTKVFFKNLNFTWYSMANQIFKIIWKTANRLAKRTEIWDLKELV